MARSPAKTVTRSAEGAVTTKKRRLTRVEPRPGQTLTSAEENVMRMHHGLDAGLHTPLPTNAINAAIRQQLLEIELRAYQATGRWQDRAEDGAEEAEPAAAPARATARKAAPSAAKEKIVSRLKGR